jgi:hypothetical protein
MTLTDPFNTHHSKRSRDLSIFTTVFGGNTGVGALYFEVFKLAAHVERRLLCRFQVCWAAALVVDGTGHEVGMELVRFLPWKNRRM